MIAQQALFPSVWRWRGLVGSSSARFSEDRRYRYELRRTWKPELKPLVACLLNPSKSDEQSTDDNTTKRLLDFADSWGLGGLVLVNAFALMSTDPRGLKSLVRSGGDAVGADNDATLRRIFREHADDRLLLGWGTHGVIEGRGRDVAAMARELHGRPECFALTKNGQPWHPLMLPSTSTPALFAELSLTAGARR